MIDVKFNYPYYILTVDGVQIDKNFNSCKEAVDYYEKELMNSNQKDNDIKGEEK